MNFTRQTEGDEMTATANIIDIAMTELDRYGIPADRWANGEELSDKPLVRAIPGGVRVIWRYDDFEGPDKSGRFPMAIDFVGGGIRNAEADAFGDRFTSSGARGFARRNAA